MRIWVIVVAGGQGRRFTQTDSKQKFPKQFTLIHEQFLLAWTLKIFLRHPAISGVILTTQTIPTEPACACQHWQNLCMEYQQKLTCVAGGAERVWSVRNGVLALQNHSKWQVQPQDFILVHDGVRPCLHAADLEALIAAAQAGNTATTQTGVMLGQPVTDSLKRVTHGQIEASVERDGLWQAMTPQGFSLAAFQQAFVALEQTIKCRNAVGLPTDECQLLAASSAISVQCVAATYPNPKLTYPHDLPVIQALLANQC